MELPGRILVIGCGSVSQCTVPLLLKEIDVPPSSITVLDMVDNRDRIADALAAGVRYEIGQITPDNLDAELSRHSGPATSASTWRGTSTRAPSSTGAASTASATSTRRPSCGTRTRHAATTHPRERTLYVRHMALRRMIARWGHNDGSVGRGGARRQPRAGVALHQAGARGDRHARASRTDAPRETPPPSRRALADAPLRRPRPAARRQGHPHLRTRHADHRSQPKEVNEFVNTWSIEGFYEEGIAPAEMGWGTHEKRLPPHAFAARRRRARQPDLPGPDGVQDVGALLGAGGEIVGMVIRHGEAFTICDHLTVWDGGRPVYRPTVHYAYCPADVAVLSMLELRDAPVRRSSRASASWATRSSRARTSSASCSWATRTRRGGPAACCRSTRRGPWCPHQNATTLQVAASILGAAAVDDRRAPRGACGCPTSCRGGR